MGWFWWKRGGRDNVSSSCRSAGSDAPVTQERETLLRAEPAKYRSGGGQEALGVASLFAGMYVFPLS